MDRTSVPSLTPLVGYNQLAPVSVWTEVTLSPALTPVTASEDSRYLLLYLYREVHETSLPFPTGQSWKEFSKGPLLLYGEVVKDTRSSRRSLS